MSQIIVGVIKIEHAKFSQKSNFGMIEVALAAFILTTALMGISSLFITGMESQKRAVSSSMAVDGAEQFLSLNATFIKTDWNWSFIFANSKPTADDHELEWNIDPIFEHQNIVISPEVDFDPSFDLNSGYFLLEQLTDGRVDHRAIMRLWKDLQINENGSIKGTLYLEVSWRAELPYHSREKQIFTLEVFKAPEIELASSDPNCWIAKALPLGVVSTTGPLLSSPNWGGSTLFNSTASPLTSGGSVTLNSVLKGSRIVEFIFENPNNFTYLDELYIQCPVNTTDYFATYEMNGKVEPIPITTGGDFAKWGTRIYGRSLWGRRQGL